MSAAAQKKKSDVTIVKKYANRRLYDTGRSSYVTLDDLSEMVREGHDFIVVDAKTGEDITQSVLTQMMVEEESKGENMLPASFLRELIKFYGDSVQSVIPDYLEQSMQNFVKHQEEMRTALNSSLEQTMKPLNAPLNMMEEMSKTNMKLMNNTLKAFSPFQMFQGDSINFDHLEPKERAAEIRKTIKDLTKQLEELEK